MIFFFPSAPNTDSTIIFALVQANQGVQSGDYKDIPVPQAESTLAPFSEIFTTLGGSSNTITDNSPMVQEEKCSAIPSAIGDGFKVLSYSSNTEIADASSTLVVDEVYSDAQALGLTVIRTWAFNDGNK